MGRRPLRPPFKFLKIWMGGADASTTFELGSYEKQDRESKRNCLKVFTERERTRKFFEGFHGTRKIKEISEGFPGTRKNKNFFEDFHK